MSSARSKAPCRQTRKPRPLELDAPLTYTHAHTRTHTNTYTHTHTHTHTHTLCWVTHKPTVVGTQGHTEHKLGLQQAPQAWTWLRWSVSESWTFRLRWYVVEHRK